MSEAQEIPRRDNKLPTYLNHNNLTAHVNVTVVSPSRSRFENRFKSRLWCLCERGVWMTGAGGSLSLCGEARASSWCITSILCINCQKPWLLPCLSLSHLHLVQLLLYYNPLSTKGSWHVVPCQSFLFLSSTRKCCTHSRSRGPVKLELIILSLQLIVR